MSSVLVIAAIVSLAVLSMVMAGTAIWLMRANRAEPAPLAPLEVLGEPMWQQAAPEERALILDAVRPDPLREVAREPLEAAEPEPRDPSNPIPVITQGVAREPPASPE